MNKLGTFARNTSDKARVKIFGDWLLKLSKKWAIIMRHTRLFRRQLVSSLNH